MTTFDIRKATISMMSLFTRLNEGHSSFLMLDEQLFVLLCLLLISFLRQRAPKHDMEKGRKRP